MDGRASISSQSPTAMFVRANYTYEPPENTEMRLSFEKGDVIQVINQQVKNQQESGWWDGVLNGKRGWFPSNFCQVITNSSDPARPPSDIDSQNSDDDELDYRPTHHQNSSYMHDAPGGHSDPNSFALHSEDQEQEEAAAFWIPQATPEGRLYYYNTLTGISRMELPLEQLSMEDDPGPRDRHNIHIPETTRPPLQEIDEATDIDHSDDDTAYQSSRLHQHHPYANTDPPATHTTNSNGTTTMSFAGALGNPLRHFLDPNAKAEPLTWHSLMSNFRKAVERYRYSVEHQNRSDIVRRAEDISDHLRLLLAAGSGTTDNHSGNPSIVGSNKALYPLFRETMARFSKLILSSHMAAADFPPVEAQIKCLQEAGGMLHAVHGFVEVARQQRGDEIPRLVPGFVSRGTTGGTWRNNGLSITQPTSALSRAPSFNEFEDNDDVVEPKLTLDASSLNQLSSLHMSIEQALKRLNDCLVVQDMLITPSRHRTIGDKICRAATKVLELYKSFVPTVESLNLAPLGVDATDPQIREYSKCKQELYNQTCELLISCQAVTSPLADEWADRRSDPLEDRLRSVASVSKDLERCTSKLMEHVRILADNMPINDALFLMEAGKQRDATHHHWDQSQPQSRSKQMYGDDPMLAEPVRSTGPSKIERIFGEVPVSLITSTPQPGIALEETPAFLRLDHENELAFDNRVSPPSLRGGTLVALVEQLTRHDRLDSELNNTFLLTYQSFTTANELFELLVKRWGIQPPPGLTQENYQLWVDKKQKPIQFRVVNILKNWFDTYFLEANSSETKALLQRIMTFAREHVATTNTPGAAPLMMSIEQRLNGSNPSNKRLVLTVNSQIPPSILPKNLKKIKFLDIDPLEFARQLTIIESQLYNKIKPSECLTKTWQKPVKPGDEDHAANIKALILHANQLTNWVAQMILNQSELRRRVFVIKHFILVAEKCRAMNNFSTLTSIISSFATAPVHRLRRTWKQVNAKTMQTLDGLRELISSDKNFSNYRDALHKSNPPCIPFFGVFLTDLVFIEDGIPSLLRKNNLISFAKRAKTAEVIRDIQQYQNVPYSLHVVPELQEYMVNNMRMAQDVFKMYDKSLQVEPKTNEPEVEKIARLLEESGFL